MTGIHNRYTRIIYSRVRFVYEEFHVNLQSHIFSVQKNCPLSHWVHSFPFLNGCCPAPLYHINHFSNDQRTIGTHRTPASTSAFYEFHMLVGITLSVFYFLCNVRGCNRQFRPRLIVVYLSHILNPSIKQAVWPVQKQYADRQTDRRTKADNKRKLNKQTDRNRNYKQQYGKFTKITESINQSDYFGQKTDKGKIQTNRGLQ